MYIFPFRGIRCGDQVDEIELGPNGAKYDRELLLTYKHNTEIVTGKKYQGLRWLRQTLKNGVVTITTVKPELLRAKGLPESIQIDLKVDPASVGPLYVREADKVPTVVQAVPPMSAFEGYQYNETVCEWFSAAVDKEVLCFRSPPTRRTVLTTKRNKGLFFID